MRALLLITITLLLTGNSSGVKTNISSSNLLVNGTKKIDFNELIELNDKPKMFIFYSSQHCGPCLKQLNLIEASLDDLDKKFQLVFVDSWTLGLAKKHQTKEYALDFYNSKLKTKNSMFILDSEDKLLHDFQKEKPLKYSLPFLGVINAEQELLKTSSNFQSIINL